jgi:ubiquitin C-terminal hydrolase
MASHGIANLGNTCCVSSLVQCLRHSHVLVDALKKSIEDANTPKSSVAYQLLDVIMKIQKDTVTPSGLIQTLKTSLGSRINIGEQLDMVELWMLVVDQIQKEVGIALTEQEREVNMDNGLRERCIASRQMFNEYKKSAWLDAVQGTQMSVTRCQCGFAQGNIEVFTCVQLDLCENVAKSLEKYMESEHLDNWKCDKCGEKEKASKQVIFMKLPPVLLITLKRFKCENGTFTKVTSDIDITEAFELMTPDESSAYRIKSVGQHHGSYTGGHYTSMCRDNEDIWTMYDDLTTFRCGRVLGFDSTNAQAAYFLVYQTT